MNITVIELLKAKIEKCDRAIENAARVGKYEIAYRYDLQKEVYEDLILTIEHDKIERVKNHV
jgi:hypothetical protein